jgi:hypothetical protein
MASHEKVKSPNSPFIIMLDFETALSVDVTPLFFLRDNANIKEPL